MLCCYILQIEVVEACLNFCPRLLPVSFYETIAHIVSQFRKYWKNDCLEIVVFLMRLILIKFIFQYIEKFKKKQVKKLRFKFEWLNLTRIMWPEKQICTVCQELKMTFKNASCLYCFYMNTVFFA